MGKRSGMALAVTVGVAIVVGCSAQGTTDTTVDETAPAAVPPASPLPPSNTGGGDPAPAPASKDAGSKDSGVDAGPPPPEPNTPCPIANALATKSCGKCGKSTAVCVGGGDAGGGTWSAYGPCENEVGVCVPGSQEACGNCGKATCTSYCAWGACNGQPANACVPGAVELSTAGCTVADTFRQRTCSATCTYDNFSAACTAPPTSVEVPPTIGSSNTTIVLLKAATQLTKVTNFCPNATVATGTTPGAFIKVHNPNAKAATVTIFNSQAPGGPATLPTLLASYAGATPPSTDAQKKKCVKGVSDFSDDTLTGDFDFAALADGDEVTVPANGNVTIYNASQAKASTGKVLFTVRLDALAP